MSRSDPVRATPHTEFHKNGSVRAQGHRDADGQPVGFWTWFRLDGTWLRSGHLDKGQPVGEWTTYDRQGLVYKVSQVKPPKQPR